MLKTEIQFLDNIKKHEDTYYLEYILLKDKKFTDFINRELERSFREMMLYGTVQLTVVE